MTIQELRQKYKIFGLAAFDLILSFIGTILLFIFLRYMYFKDLYVVNFIIAGILLTLPLAIFFHILFGVNTQLNYVLGLSNKPK